MSGEPLKIILFLGTTRIGRNGLRVAKFMQKKLTQKGFTVEFFDPLELNLPVLLQPMHFYRDPKDVPQILPKLNDKINSADGFVVVSGEYNHAIPPALTNMMDHFPPSSYAFKPSMIVTYSVGRGAGGFSAAQLGTFLQGLGCSAIPMMASVAEVSKAMDEEGNGANEFLEKRVDGALEQLEWYASAMKDKRRKDGVINHRF